MSTNPSREQLIQIAAERMAEGVIQERENIKTLFNGLGIEFNMENFVIGTLWVSFSLMGMRLDECAKLEPDFFKATLQRCKDAG